MGKQPEYGTENKHELPPLSSITVAEVIFNICVIKLFLSRAGIRINTLTLKPF